MEQEKEQKKIEQKILNVLNKKLNLNLKLFDYKYNIIDAIDENNKIICEIKKRTCNFNSFDDTICGYNKHKRWKSKYSDYDFIFVVEFLEGDIYYYKFEPDEEINIKTNNIDCNFSFQKKEQNKKHISLSIKKLIQIKNKKRKICLIED